MNERGMLAMLKPVDADAELYDFCPKDAFSVSSVRFDLAEIWPIPEKTLAASVRAWDFWSMLKFRPLRIEAFSIRICLVPWEMKCSVFLLEPIRIRGEGLGEPSSDLRSFRRIWLFDRTLVLCSIRSRKGASCSRKRAPRVLRAPCVVWRVWAFP